MGSSRTVAEKQELLKETKYRDRVQEILKKHRGTLQAAYNATPEDGSSIDGNDPVPMKEKYAAENRIIQRVMTNERSAFLSGLALSGLVFASVRFGPRYLAVRINPDKARKLKEADEIAEKANTRWIQKTAAFVFEASFGAWAGWRGYNIVSAQNKNSYEEISKIPLCAGMSSVSENVCPDFVSLVHKEIPRAFWSHLDDGEDTQMKDPQRWQSVRDFADNCIKRKVYEDSYRKQNGLDPGISVDIPKGGVPENILLSMNKKT